MHDKADFSRKQLAFVRHLDVRRFFYIRRLFFWSADLQVQFRNTVFLYQPAGQFILPWRRIVLLSEFFKSVHLKLFPTEIALSRIH